MIRRRFFLLPGLMVLLVLACKKEYSYEGGLHRKCIGCSYLPLCDSSKFVYVDSSNTTDTLRGTVVLGTDTTIKGIKYERVSGLAVLGNSLLYNCSNEDYKTYLSIAALGINTDSIVQVLLQTIQLPIPIPPGLIQIPSDFKTSFLKAGLPTGSTWTDTIYSLSLPPFLTLFAGLNYSIAEKGIQRQVFQKNFSNVIHVTAKLKIVSTIALPAIPDISIDYFFAKDVGIVELQIRNNQVLTTSTRLYSYQL